jgi:cytoskeletal protein RodZ
MKTVGQILHETRVQKRLELEDVARVTRIRIQFLTAIEADDFSNLPSSNVAKGFIRNYGEFLGMDVKQLLAVFRRDFVEDARGQIIPRGFDTPAEKISFWTPRTTFLSAIALVVTLFLVYLFYQYRILTGPPELIVTRPTDKVSVEEVNILVEGRTDPEATLSVNGQLVALEKGGTFSFRVPLNPGENTITITATAQSGKTASLTRLITLR